MSGKPGRSGRRPQPTAITILKGNPGGRPLPPDEPRLTPKLPAAPTYLSDVAKAEWRRTGKRLLSMGVMTEIDSSALAAYCQTYARWVEAEQKLNEQGVLIQGADGTDVWSQSPYLSIANKALEQMQKLLVEFGMTPSSRTRVKAQPQAEADPFEEFLGSRAN